MSEHRSHTEPGFGLCRMGRIRNLFTPNNSGASPAVDLILPSLSQLGTGMLFNGEYIIQPGRAQTSGSVVAYGHNMQDANSKVFLHQTAVCPPVASGQELGLCVGDCTFQPG